MTQHKQFASALLALGISIAMQASATDAPAASWLMSEAEIATHTAAMGALQGAARDDYRNAQYEQLKKRALEHGFKLPGDPPWNGATAVTANTAAQTAGAGDDAAAEAAARHAAMREKLQARREAMQRDSEANLEQLQEAANAQQQQIEAQLQAGRQHELQGMDKDIAEPATAGGRPPAPPVTPATAPAAADIATSMATPAAPAVAEAPTVRTTTPAAPPTAPTPPIAPSPPTPPTLTATESADSEPLFAPVEATAAPLPLPERADSPADNATAGPSYANSDAMTAYRETMRKRFDEYMQERQAQVQENAKRQREQHEAAMEKNRSLRANRNPYPSNQPYPYPTMPSYGPRYPAAYPGYRTPYWQQR